ncbi:DUF6011 domain-containing protein [Frankia sp. R82]|uniref:DUF6011 domain-containing protein n=1 Tax=Frankia sp. R82 TaxID=2950553 RepID=UPI0035ABF405
MGDREEPGYFAVPDPLDGTRMSYWYRSRAARSAGQLAPWPPRRNRWGHLLKRDVPFDKAADPPGYRAFVREHFDRVFDARVEARRLIEADPDAASARFAALAIRCCWCGKQLADEHSRVYGVGPECRQGLSAEELARMVELVAAAHAEVLSDA